MSHRVVVASAAALLLSACGCSQKTKIQVQSDTCWDGFIVSQRVAACGDKTYEITGKFTCARLQKQTVQGYLRLRIEGRTWEETTAPAGEVAVCK